MGWLVLLAGLPEKYSPMLMAIEHAGISITTDVIKSKLLDVEIGGSSGSKGGAFVAKVGNFKKKPRGGASGKNNDSRTAGDMKTRDFSKITCFKCKQQGHFMSKCPNGADNSKPGEKYAFSAIFLNGKYNKKDFYLDSGASKHMTPNESWIKNSSESVTREIIVANKEKLLVKCSGELDIVTSVGEKSYEITVEDVLGVPGLTTNLLSVSQLISKGNKIEFTGDGCSIYNHGNKLLAMANLVDGVYKLNLKEESYMLGISSKSEMWHRRLAHINSQDLNKMVNCVEGLTLGGKSRIDKNHCSVCCEGKLQGKYQGYLFQTKVQEALIH